MKFGRQFDFHKIPEWSEFYLDFKALKTHLKKIQKIRKRYWKRHSLKKLIEEKKANAVVAVEDPIQNDNNADMLLKINSEIKLIENQAKTDDLKENLIKNRTNGSYKVSPIQENLDFIKFTPSKTFPRESTISDSVFDFNLESNFYSINKNIHSEGKLKMIDPDLGIENIGNPDDSLSDYEKESYLLRYQFISLYKEKMKIVNDFYKDKLNEITNDYLKLKNKMNTKKQSLADNSFAGKDVTFSKSMHHSIKKENAERDELGFAVSWKRALSQLYNTASWLNSYMSINSIANQKILKKMTRVFKDNDIENAKDEVEQITNIVNFPDKNEQIGNVSKRIKDCYAEQLTNGDKNMAQKELDDRMKGTRYKDIITIAFYSGMIVSLLFAIFLLSNITKTTETNDSILVFFPSFNFVFIVALILVGLAINIMVFRKYRINYIYIFEIDPNLRIGHNEITRIFLFLMNVWLILLLLTISSLSFQIFTPDFFAYPMVLICFFTIFMLLPFHFFYYNFRKGIIITLIRNIFPIGRNGVRFRDFMFGDILTSLTRPFATLCLSMCLLSCVKCRDENIRSTCTRNSIIALVLILAPFVIRFFQCLNRYYYTKMAWPHIGNAIKYLGGITFNLFSWMFAVYKNEYYYHFLISACAANGYMLFWDIYMDWNLGRNFTNNFFLRDKIVYPKWMYYLAIVTNSILRLTWLTSLPGVNLYIDDEMKVFLLSILEIYRRSQWSLFRVENENTNNPEKYRTILDIPKLPIND